MRSSRCWSLVSVAVGGALYLGKQRFEAPGPLAEDKVVNIPRGLGIRDIADLLEREGVIDQPWVFIGGVLVLKARGDLKSGEYQFTKHASLADVVDTIIEGKVVQHALTIAGGADLRADRRPAVGERRARPARSRKSRAKARCCRRPTNSPAA